MVVQYKHKKTCFTLLRSMERDHDIKPGSIFRIEQRSWLSVCTADVDNEKVVITRPSQGYMRQEMIDVDEHIMFLDVIYDPFMKKHLLRFLHGSKMLAFVYHKGRTLKEMKQCMVLVPHKLDETLEEETPNA